MTIYGVGCVDIDTTYNPYLIVSRPERLPVSIDDLKLQVRDEECDNSQDGLMKAIIQAVAGYFEKYTSRTLLNTTFKTFRDYFPGYIEFRKSMFQSLVSFQYYKAGVLTTVDSSTYQITQSSDYSRIIPLVNQYFPQDADTRAQAVEITFIAGFGQRSSDIPDDIKTGLLQHAAYMWTNRGDCDCGDPGSALPAVAKSIYGLNRIKNITSLAI